MFHSQQIGPPASQYGGVWHEYILLFEKKYDLAERKFESTILPFGHCLPLAVVPCGGPQVTEHYDYIVRCI